MPVFMLRVTRNSESYLEPSLLHLSQAGTVMRFGGYGSWNIALGGTWSRVVASRMPQIAHHRLRVEAGSTAI